MELKPAEQALIKQIYQRLVDNPLMPNDPLYERVYVRTEGEDPVAKLQTHIEFTTVESLQLFSGFRGTGKTTELYRLQGRLQKAGYVVLYADALEYLSPSEEVDIVTMLMSVAGAFGEQLEKAEGGKLLQESFWKRIGKYLTRTTIEVNEVAVKVEGNTPGKELLGELKAGVDLKAALKTAPSFRQKLHEFLGNRIGELKKEVNAFVEEGIKQLRTAYGKEDLGVVFLFDQFEQVRGSRSNEQSVIQSIDQLFANYIELLRLPYTHVIYTVPPSLQFVRPGAFSIKTLPCVRLWHNDEKRSRDETGWKHFRDAILKRFGPENFSHIFGDEPQRAEALEAKLIEMSGGHFRDLLRLFREVIVLISAWRPTLPINEEVVERAIINIRNEYLPIAIDDARWLAKIEKQRKTALPDLTPASIGRLGRFLDTHLVLYLKNGEDWYDLHPIIRSEVLELAKSEAPEEV